MVASIFVLMMATYKLHDIRISSIIQSNHFRLAGILLLLLVLFWPLIQLERYGYRSIHKAYVLEMVERFSPIGASGGTVETAWYKVLIDEALLWIPALIAVIVIPFLFRTLKSFIPCLLVLGFCIMMEVASGSLFARYILLIWPLLAAGLGALFSKIVPGKPSGLLLAFILSLPPGGPFKQAQALGLLESSQTQYRQITRKLPNGPETPRVVRYLRRLGREEVNDDLSRKPIVLCEQWAADTYAEASRRFVEEGAY